MRKKEYMESEEADAGGALPLQWAKRVMSPSQTTSEVVKIQHARFHSHWDSFSSTFCIDFSSHLFILNVNEFQKKKKYNREFRWELHFRI